MAEEHATRADLEAGLTKLQTSVLERIEKFETTLVAEFRKWAVPTAARLTSLETLNERVLLIEERLDQLEKR